MKLTTIAASLALAAFASGAQAVTTHTVGNLSIVEIGASSNLAAADAGTGGGIFYFGAEAGDGVRNVGVPVFNSTGAGAVGIVADGVGQNVNTISTGFNYGGLAFDMDTMGTNAKPAGGVVASIADNNTLVIDLAAWGGYWAGTGSHHHMLNPDAGTLVTSLENVGGTWYYTADWSHTITLAEDYNDGIGDYNGFAGQRADWHIEGQLSNVALVPEASTYGMMLAGLGLVGFAVRRRKLVA